MVKSNQQKSKPIRILLVDDHPLVLDGIASCLEDEPGIKVVATANNGEEAINIAIDLSPDIVLLDIAMPIMDGLEATRRFIEILPQCRILILSMHDDQEYILKLMQLGASGYVLKDVASDELIKAIETVHLGNTYFSSGASQSLFSGFNAAKAKQESVLTNREQTILRYIAEGKSNKAIARKLDISVRTVETHRQNIKAKLQTNTTAGLIRHAIDLGLLK